jgi:predicted PurR-regulated permease PerM
MELENNQLEKTTHASILLFLRVGFVGLLLFMSFKIVAPFLMPIVWGVIISIGIYPIFEKISSLIGGRKSIAATILVLVGIALFVVPFAMLIMSTAESIENFVDHLNLGTFKIPPPPADVVDWPLIGERLFDFWAKSSENLMVLIERIKPFLTRFLPTIFSSAAGVVGTIFQFIFSVIIAGVLLVYADGGRKVAVSTFRVIIGDAGEGFVNLSKSTINGVVRGVLGTAIIQTVLLGLGMFVIGVPGAGIWTVLVLLVAIIQLPPTLIMLPIIIYVFSVESTTIAVIFTIWSVVWSMSDSVIKPILMGKGSDIPMLVILIGSIGGMMAFGIIGLFVGSVVLAITYEVFVAIGKKQEDKEKVE